MIVGRVLPKSAFKHIPCHVLGEQRILWVREIDGVFVISKDGICGCPELYGIPQ